MKKVFALSSLLALGAVASYGTQLCSAVGNQVSAASLAGFSCEIGDKIFDNISLTGGATTGIVSFAGAGTLYTLDFNNFNAPLTTGFTFSFRVTVDTVAQPLNYITQIQDQIQTSTLGGIQLPNTSTAVVTHTPGGVVNLSGTTSGQSGAATINNVTDTVSFVYTPGADGKIADASFGISQAAIPEPMTFSLMGAGLLGLGLLRKRISRS